jgi:hypothetical protein
MNFEPPIEEPDYDELPEQPWNDEHANELCELEEPTSFICSIIKDRKQKFLNDLEVENGTTN